MQDKIALGEQADWTRRMTARKAALPTTTPPVVKAPREFRTYRGIIAPALCLTLVSVVAAAQDCKRTNVDRPMYNASYRGDRFSPLQQITRENVSSLAEVGRYQLSETTSLQTGRVSMGDAMYITTATNTYEQDTVAGKPVWSEHDAANSLGLNTPVHGVVHADGWPFRGTPDAHVIASDAKTGTAVWDVVGGDAATGEYASAAPVAWGGRPSLGNAGSDPGARGHIAAYDIKDGRKI
jgi:alcohol dehydrogenase (cytochrome c)